MALLLLTGCQQPKALEISARANALGEFFLRGKVAYLFERYAAERELNALLLCIKESNNAFDATIRQSIRNWINRTHGATPEGRAQLQRLAADADVIVQNYRPGVAERMGVGWAELSARKPALVYVSISGWGSSGPMAHVPTLDTTMQAASGMMHANRGEDGRPRRIGLYLVDYATGLYAAQATLAALLRQARSGRGRHVEVAMLQAAAVLQNYLSIDAAMFPQQQGGAFNAPTGLFDTADGRQLYVSMLNDAMFLRLARALGMDGWIADAGLHASSGRLPRAQELNQALADRLGQGTLAHWSGLLARHDILFAPLRSPGELPQDAQARHLKVFAEQLVPGVGPVPLAGLPGGAGTLPLEPAPRLGQHNAELLGA